ncbi:MAG TPA: M20/M25/M40 family metallo-hydrolase [Candidatus Saccharimonadales bacterium]|jgi:acetylornithine deacetylase/succinyl-diaminopimelate desuccinylase-like protein|nr:M20/M25/M40 family metallo-hydrolase [Candidatus Saccharimonadales bacterium]
MKSLKTLAITLILVSAALGQSALTPNQQLAHDIFKELIEINTTDTPKGNVSKAAEAVARRLRAAGFPEQDIELSGPTATKYNLVARIHGRGRGKPILFLAHLDVVEALPQDWTTDPFKLIEKDGFFYGRGTTDIKEGDALLVANFIRLKQEGWIPARDLIMALTADEEGGDHNGVQWLIANHRNLIDAEYCINTDGGTFAIKAGKRQQLGMQTSEKNYVDFRLEVKNKGGHSSRPVRDNAIYHLAQGLARLQQFDFPVQLNETTQGYFERSAPLQEPSLAAAFRAIAANPKDEQALARLTQSPYLNALLRTTCVATRLEGGHANNALPQSARANVNCRMLPTDSLQNVQNTLKRVLADDRISVEVVGEAIPAPASAINPVVLHKLEELSARLYGGLPIVPVMDAGASDGKYLRIAGIPTFGVPGVFTDIDDDRAHGKDERLGVKDFYEGVDFYYLFIKSLVERD